MLAEGPVDSWKETAVPSALKAKGGPSAEGPTWRLRDQSRNPGGCSWLAPRAYGPSVGHAKAPAVVGKAGRVSLEPAWRLGKVFGNSLPTSPTLSRATFSRE